MRVVPPSMIIWQTQDSNGQANLWSYSHFRIGSVIEKDIVLPRSVVVEWMFETGHIVRRGSSMRMPLLGVLTQTPDSLSRGSHKVSVPGIPSAKAFASNLTNSMSMVRYILLICLVVRCPNCNRAGKGEFFRARKDTLHAENMFGSLVFTLPTRYEGGNLLLRHWSRELEFNATALLQSTSSKCAAYAAFYSDVDHEVLEVTSGNRITVTFNLYFDPFRAAPILPKKSPKVPKNPFTMTLREVFRDAAFIRNHKFLGFGLEYEYPAKYTEGYTQRLLDKNLKGPDAFLYRMLQETGLNPSLRYLYESTVMGVIVIFGLCFLRWSMDEQLMTIGMRRLRNCHTSLKNRKTRHALYGRMESWRRRRKEVRCAVHGSNPTLMTSRNTGIIRLMSLGSLSQMAIFMGKLCLPTLETKRFIITKFASW